MERASLLKRILDALKDLVEDTNFDCGPVRGGRDPLIRRLALC